MIVLIEELDDGDVFLGVVDTFKEAQQVLKEKFKLDSLPTFSEVSMNHKFDFSPAKNPVKTFFYKDKINSVALHKYR